MKVKIISDGTAHGTKVVDVETGKVLERIQDLQFAVGVGKFVTVIMQLVNVEAEVLGDAVVRTADSKENLCDTCEFHPADCGGNHESMKFGDAAGMDNVIECDGYRRANVAVSLCDSCTLNRCTFTPSPDVLATRDKVGRMIVEECGKHKKRG